MSLLINWLVSAIAIAITSYILPGVHVANFYVALVVVVVLGVANAVLKPLLFFLTLPINILTLGLFTLVINAILVILTSMLVPGFLVDSFWWALAFSLVLSLVNSFLHHLSTR